MLRAHKKEHKLCIFTLYDTRGASSRFRIYQYQEKFDKDYETNIFYFWPNKYIDVYIKDRKKYLLQILFCYIRALISRICQILFIAVHADIVIFQKAIIPKFPIFLIRFLKKHGVKLVFDVDDAIYLQKGDYSIKYVSDMDLILVGNNQLKLFYQKYNSMTKLIPTVEKSSLYRNVIHNTYENKCIGWMGSLRTIDNLDLVVNAINAVIKKHPEIKFKIISDGSAGYDECIKNAIFEKWDENYIEHIKEFSIGIMPLKDTAFNEGKCGFKLIQYLNLQIPVLASNVGINAEIIADYGYICRTEAEWENNIEKLLFEEEEYIKCKENIKRTFNKRYGYEENWKLIQDSLKSLISN